MKEKPQKKPQKKPSRRKNISLHPDVQKMLAEMAEKEYTSASALLTTMILERMSKTSAPTNQQPMSGEPVTLKSVPRTTVKKTNNG